MVDYPEDDREYESISPYDLWGYSPTIPAFGSSYIQPYYDPFNPGLGYGQPNTPPIEEVIDQTPTCEEGMVLDEETNTCVPIEVAMEAVEKGDRDKASFAPIPDGKGGFVSIADLFDGGGAGRSGLTFKGPLAKYANFLGIRPRGYATAMSNVNRIQGGSSPAAVKALADAKNIEALSKVSQDQFKDNIDSGKIVYSNDDDGPTHEEILEMHGHTVASGDHYGGSAEEETALINSDLTDDEVFEAFDGENRGGLISTSRPKYAKYKRGGGEVMNGLIAYRQSGGPLPGAVPTLEDQAAMAQQPPMDPMAGGMPPMDPMAAQGGMPEAPMAPPVPPAPPSFSDKVGQALEKIRSGRTTVPANPALAAPAPTGPMMTDGQGNGPVEIMPGAGNVTQEMVGPDMGPDTVDSELEEGSFVLNPEASEMYGEEVRAMMYGGAVYKQGGGIVGMANDASQALGQASQAIEQASGSLNGSGGSNLPAFNVGTGLGGSWAGTSAYQPLSGLGNIANFRKLGGIQ